MSRYEQLIRGDLNSFQIAVCSMSNGMKAAGTLWKDNNYSQLYAAIAALANQSLDVLNSGDKLCETITKFDKVSEEIY